MEIDRPSPEIVSELKKLGTDAVTSAMESLGVRRTFMEGPVCRVPGSKIVGPALTFRFVPQREDQMKGYSAPGVAPEEEEEGEKTSALCVQRLCQGNGPAIMSVVAVSSQ